MNAHAQTALGSRVNPYPRDASLSLLTQRRLLRLVLTLSDAFALGAAFRIAFWFRFDLGWTIAPEVIPDPHFYPSLAALMVPVWILVFTVFDLYDPHRLLGGVREYSRVFNACTTGTILVVLATFVEPGFVVSRFWVLVSWGASLFLILANRFFWRRIVYWLRPKGYLLVPSAIVGTNEEAVALARDLQDWRLSGLRIRGFISTEKTNGIKNLEGLPILGSVRDTPAIVAQHGIEDLVVSITSLDREELLRLCEDVNTLQDVHLRLSSGLYELLTTRVEVRTLGPVPLISLNKIRLEPQEVYVKTLLEYSIAALALLILSPLLVLIAVLIKLDSPGPVFHRRLVMGVSGRTFNALKFRSMHVDGDRLLATDPALEERLKSDHKLKADPRVTRVGQWLRRYSLDELPQLFNVLMGQMGLVGPRMITPEEMEKYGSHKLNLLTVKPGITGLWQVSGRSDLSYEERVRLDMYYIRNYSVWLDLQILFIQTPPAVLRGRGAY